MTKCNRKQVEKYINKRNKIIEQIKTIKIVIDHNDWREGTGCYHEVDVEQQHCIQQVQNILSLFGINKPAWLSLKEDWKGKTQRIYTKFPNKND